jgi:nicotinamide phosphoribosyltransferase
MLTIKEFLAGTPKVPRPLVADAYTIGSIHLSKEEKERAVFHVVPRRGMDKWHSFATDDRLIFTGLIRILRDFFSTPVTMEEIEEADKFLKTFHAGGVPYRWDRAMWERIVTENHGIIPIEIDAFEEGTVAFPYEPMIQVTTGVGFGGLGVWFESKLLQVWSSIERVTTLKWWLEYLKKRCREIHPSWSEAQVAFACGIACHDFGDRAGSCSQESEVLGLAHTLVFAGTDTVAGAYQFWKNSGEQPGGCSIHALAHHTVTGFQREARAHEALYNIGKETGITAHVSDTNNFFATVDTLVGNLLRNDLINDKNILVLRPDSGDPAECILHILKTCEKYGVYAESDGLKVATRIRWIQGDSMDWETMQSIIDLCIYHGWSPFGSGAFGVGGHLRNSIARDHTGLSMKLAEVGVKARHTVKKSETPAKSSIPGEVVVIDNGKDDRPTVHLAHSIGIVDPTRKSNLLVPYYDGRRATTLAEAFKPAALVSPVEVKARIASDFMRRVRPTNVLSHEILDERARMLSGDNW